VVALRPPRARRLGKDRVEAGETDWEDLLSGILAETDSEECLADVCLIDCENR